jgi:hypothetical protein
MYANKLVTVVFPRVIYRALSAAQAEANRTATDQALAALEAAKPAAAQAKPAATGEGG